MTKARDRLRLFLCSAICLWLCGPAVAQVSVLQQHNDNGRTGLNSSETILSPSTVNVSNFGKLFWRTVDGYIYAQPLYVSGLNIGGTTRNVVFVATEHNSVYAFDADDPNHATPLWHVNLGTPVPSDDVCVPLNVCPYDDLQPEIGITSTPAIDVAGNAIFVVAHTKDSSSNYHFFLHKLSLTTGADMVPAAEITTTSPNLPFKPLFQLNRPGLLLLNGAVYMAFGSAGDFGDWHGWVMSYSTSTLAQLHVYNDTPGDVQNFVPGESGGGGIFSCGQALVTDGTYVYFFTGNGPFDANSGGQDYADSAIKLQASNLAFVDFFTPSDALTLGQNNIDLGAGGPLLLPGTHLLIGGGKDGMLRLLDTTSMGGFHATDQAVQEWAATSAWIMGSPVYWNGTTLGQAIYLWPSGDVPKAYKFNGSTFGTSAITGSITSPGGESDTSPMSVSANGQQGGILWAPTSTVGDPNKSIQPGILHALNANTMGEIWNSRQDPARDDLGYFSKFNPPTVANGKVYVGTFSGQLVVYGLNPPAPSGIAYVRGAANALTSGSSAQISASYPSSQSAGNLNIVAISWGDTTSQVQSVTDSDGNTYTRAVGPQSSSSVSQTIYYAKNIHGGSNTVTVNFNQAAFLPSVRILEYSGADTSSPLDVTATASGSSSSSEGAMADSGPATTRFSNELIFGAASGSRFVLKPGDPFDPRVTDANSNLAEDHIVNVAGSFNATATVTPGSNWVMQMAAFKAAAQPAGSFSLSLSSTTQDIVPGFSASFVVTVNGDSGFSGAVSLACSGLPAHTSCSFNPASPNAGSTSTLTVSSDSSLATGTYPFSIVGTSGSLPQQEASASLVAQQSGFAISISPGSASVSAGQSANYTITVSGKSGFNSSVSLACSGAPAGSQCSLSSSSVMPGNSATLTVSTSGPTAQLRAAPGRGTPFYAFWLVLPGMALAGMGWTGTRRRRLLVLIVGAGLFALLAFQVSCGGGGSSAPPPPGGGTPPGTYTLTVTATSGNTQLSAPVTLTVQ